MDKCIASESFSNNEKNTTVAFQEPLKNSSKLDNDSHQNNNANVIHHPSFIPVHFKRKDVPRKTQQSGETVATVTSQSSEKPQYHTMSDPVTDRSIRRHSIGVENFSVSAQAFPSNHCQDKRFQTIGHHANFPSSVSSVARTHYGAPSLNVMKDTAFRNGGNNKFQNDQNNQVITSNANQKASSDNVSSIPAYEKLKDKSFKRKSSLNRVDFVHSTPSPDNSIYHQVPSSHRRQYQHSSSDENYSKRSFLPLSPDGSTKKRSQLPVSSPVISEKEAGEGFLKRNTCDGNNKNTAQNPYKMYQNPIKIKSFRPRKTFTSHFQKKAYSAGEENSNSDQYEFTGSAKVCLSAQEMDCREGCIPLKVESTYTKPADSTDVSYETKVEPGRIVSFDIPKSKETAENICDNSSQLKETKIIDDVDVSTLTSIKTAVNSDVAVIEDVPQKCQNESITYFNHISCSKSISSNTEENYEHAVFSVHKVEVEGLENCQGVVSKDHENVVYESENIDGAVGKVACLAITSECNKNVVNADSCIIIEDVSTESEKESKQRSSILRRKGSEERKGIHGILKYTADEKYSKQPSSILKHRESSEEKDTWQPQDLHSILKKSTSEEDSCGSGMDIRPILKNTSTDEESSGLNSKPKPILKKRTSFSEECSYACFHTGELKPILKKKTLSDSEGQPKPILKTRRKSEEAGSTASEFPIGARPRAYSADRGRKVNSNTKFDDEIDFTVMEKEIHLKKKDSL